ncbi:MAG: hypothetical protein ACQERD_11975 [Campylobacterota bacterium]
MKKRYLVLLLLFCNALANDLDYSTKENCLVKSKEEYKLLCIKRHIDKNNDFSNLSFLIEANKYNKEKIQDYINKAFDKKKLLALEESYANLSDENKERLLNLQAQNLNIKAIDRIIKKDSSKLTYWYEQVKESKNYDKYYNFSKIIKFKDPSKAFELLKIAASNEHTASMFELTKDIYRNKTKKQNIDIQDYIKQAAKKQNIDALLVMYLSNTQEYIDDILNLQEDKLIEFFNQKRNFLMETHKDRLYDKLSQKGVAFVVFEKLKAINDEEKLEKKIEDTISLIDSKEFIDLTTLRDKELKNRIIEQYAKAKDSTAMLYIIKNFPNDPLTNDLVEIIKNSKDKKLKYNLAKIYESTYTYKTEALDIYEKLVQKDYYPAKRRVLSFYLSNYYDTKISYTKKIDAIAKELAQDGNEEAIGYLENKI